MAESKLYWLFHNAWEDGNLNSPDEIISFLSPGERKKAASLRFTKRRDEWLQGRMTAKKLLLASAPEYRTLSFQDIEILNAASGLPYYTLDGGRELPIHLSISHREKMAFCALTYDLEVSIGADLEKIETYADSFIDTFFSDREIEWIHSCPSEERDLKLVLIWSMKEAVFKALGQGLRLDTRHVEIVVGNEIDDAEFQWNSVEIKPVWEEEGKWIARWQRRDDYILTVAAHWDKGERSIDLLAVEG
jgi:4'-phosphopantetheinyl transferase